VLRDNLHQPQYVEKLEKIVRFMIKEKSLTLEDLDKIWDAQVVHLSVVCLVLYIPKLLYFHRNCVICSPSVLPAHLSTSKVLKVSFILQLVYGRLIVYQVTE